MTRKALEGGVSWTWQRRGRSQGGAGGDNAALAPGTPQCSTHCVPPTAMSTDPAAHGGNVRQDPRGSRRVFHTPDGFLYELLFHVQTERPRRWNGSLGAAEFASVRLILRN